MKNFDVKAINKSIFLSIVTVLLFILAMFGVTYAFFTVNISGNEQASSIVVNVANLGTVTFVDGNEINATNIYPMEPEERISKVFSITAESNTVSIDYTIYFTITENTFIQQYEHEFTYTLDGGSNNSGTTTTNVSEDVPGVGKHNIGSGILSAGGDVHTYTFTIGLNEVGSNQNSNQSKSFAGSLSVESKKYTHDRSIYDE